jgi:preprotein translocase subunit SecG
MKKENIISGLVLFFMGCFIVYTGQFSFAPGAAIVLGDYKYLVASIFFILSIFFFLGSKQQKSSADSTNSKP